MHSELATRYDLILSCISSPFATAKAGDDFPFHNLNEIFYRVPNNGEKFSKILIKTKTQLNLKQLSVSSPNNNPVSFIYRQQNFKSNTIYFLWVSYHHCTFYRFY